MDEGVDKLAANVNQAGKEMQTSLTAPGAAAEQLGKKLEIDTQKAAALRDAAKATGKELGEALSGRNIGTGIEERVEKIKKSITGAAGKGIKLGFDFDEAKLKHFESLINSGADDVKVLAEVLDYAKGKLQTLDANSEEFRELSEQVQLAEAFLTEFNGAAGQTETKSKSLRTQLREMKAALAEMEMAGQEGTQEFLDMSIAAGQVEDQIGDVSARVRVLASDTKYLDAGIQAVTGLVGAFTAAQGAVALFGEENEEVQKIIQKVTGAMAILQGIQAVAAALNKDSALSVLLFSKAQTTAAASTVALTGAEVAQTGATVAATTATRTFTAALLANPIFLVVAAVAALVTAFIAFSSGADDAEEAADKLNDTLERQNTLLKLDEGAINRRTNLLVAQAKAQGKTESEITTIEGKALAERINLRAANLDETRALLRDRNCLEKLSVEDLKKLHDTELEQQEDYNNLVNELEIKRIEREGQRRKETEDANKKAAELNRKQIEDAKRRAEELRAIQEQEIKFRRDWNAAYVETIADAYEKERESARQAVENRIQDLEREKSLSVQAEREKIELIKILRENLRAQLAEIDKKEAADRAAIALDFQKRMAEMQVEGTDRELELNRLSFAQRRKEIEEQFKKEGDLRVKLLAALAEEEKRAEKKIKDTAANDALKAEEERAVLEIETAAEFLPDLANVEKAKQVEVLKVKLDYAEKAMALLISQGNAENSTVVLQAKKQIQELKKALGVAVQELEGAGGFDLFEVLGLGNLTDEQKDEVKKAAADMLRSVQEITGFIVDQYQRQIDKRQEVIDQAEDDLKRLEDQLQTEKELQEQGLANNVDNIEAEIDAKKRQRAEEIREMEEQQKKQQAIQKAQFALDTATQASSLITSAANIFKSLSAIPFVGVPLAIATIALMTGAFVTAKVKAFQAIGEGQRTTFGRGGWIDGEKHSRGGKKYRALDGSGDVVELEQGEHVTSAKQAEKYAELLEAINGDHLDGMTNEALREMFADLGIQYGAEETREAVQIVRERDNYNQEILLMPGGDISADVRDINKNVSFLAERERNRVERWDDDFYFYERKGNTLTRKEKRK